MARLDQCQPATRQERFRSRVDFGNHALETLVKERLGVDEVQLGDCLRRHFNRRQLRAQLFRQPKQDPRDLARFAFA